MNKDLQDHVWSILPKEFKEEVKRKFQLTDANCIAYEILIDLFGIHNLTSDAEGEEILTVSRKNVQRMYSYNEEEITKDPTNKGALLLKLRLDALFGSKCRPDEGTDCTPVEVGVAENATTRNVESLEPKPAEPKFKFKKGDKVSRFYDEKVYTVDDYCEDDNLNHYILVDSLGNRVTEIEGNLKLYVGPKYHASEKVRYKGQNHEIGEIVQYWGDEDPGRYSVRFGKEYHNISESMLEPYTEPTDLNKSSETCTDNCSSQNHFVVKDEMVDNIIKDGFKNHNRLNIAAMAMQGILSNIDLFKNVLETGMETLGGDGISFRAVAKSSFLFADALINEAEEGGSK